MSAIDSVADCAGCAGAGVQKDSKTHRYGCFNRFDYVPSYTAPDGYDREGMTRVIQITHIRTTAERDCQYTKSDLGKSDPSCTGCKRKNHNQ